METYAQALLFAIPGFMGLVLIESAYGAWKGHRTLRAMDTISSLSSGITNVTKDLLGLVVVLVSYPWLVERLALFDLEPTVWVYVIGFVAIDFAGYWAHRLNHSINFFWNIHLIHHSSEEFNLPCALRQSISNILGFYAIFLLPAAIAGVPPKVIALIAPIHLFLQFWYHTRYVPKLGWLEYVIITPSQHRVHHAINPEYLDKNLGQIFPWWDRMFGTYQEELDDVPPVYGITRPVQSWNPFKINFSHWWLLLKDAWRTRSWRDRLLIWFMPTGWRPADVAERFPVPKIEDVYNFRKYEAERPPGLTSWSWGQLIVTTLLLLHMLTQIGTLTTSEVLAYGAFIGAGIFGYTSLMDRDRIGGAIEMIRGLTGVGFILATGDWFGLAAQVPGGVAAVGSYFLLCTVGGVRFQASRPAGLTSDRPSDQPSGP